MDRLNEHRTESLDRVGTGFVGPFPGGEVCVDVGRRQLPEADPGDLHPAANRWLGPGPFRQTVGKQQRDHAAADLMFAAGETLKVGAGLVGIARLAKDLTVDRHLGVGCEDRAGRAYAGADCASQRGLSLESRVGQDDPFGITLAEFDDLRRNDLEAGAELGEKLAAPRRGRSEEKVDWSRSLELREPDPDLALSRFG